MLKKIRVTISVLLFTLITFYFLDFAGLMPDDKFSWLAGIQFIPAVFAGGVMTVTVLIAGTLLFGRIYCSSICPMGIFQDVVSWMSKRTAPKKKRYLFSKAKTALRWSVLAVMAVALFAGFTVVAGVIEPYSAYGRMVVNIFRPLYLTGNNMLEVVFTRFDNYTFYKTEVFIHSVFAFVTAVVTLLFIGFLAWRYGRTYCNTVCPAGTVLGFLNRFSLFRVRIDTSECNACGVCAMQCKASCIDAGGGKTAHIDDSRCIDCFNCLGKCNKKAIRYAFGVERKRMVPSTDKAVDTGKRRFLLTTVATMAAAPALFAQDTTRLLSGGKNHTRQHPIAPPGARSAEHLLHHCTSCHLCVSRCPSRVLKPAFMEYGLGGIMQPTMYFEKGFCNFDCTVCSDICPNGALEPLTIEQKHLTQVGRVVFVQDICVVLTNGTNCGACSEHCPTQAVTMVPYRNGLTIPHIDPDICVGCGGCEFICPVRPFRAIYVEGNAEQKQTERFKEEKKQEVDIDFGF